MAAPIRQIGLFSGAPERARIERRSRGGSAQGYAAKPGTGPVNETCGSCIHCRIRTLRGSDRRVHKCHLLIGQWTYGRATDVLLRSPACARWEAGQPQHTTLKGTHHDD